MSLFDSIVQGIIAGLVLTMMIGPVFFALLQNSIENGYKSAFQMTLGISLSDSFYIAICYFGVSKFIENPTFQFWLAIVGGTIMLVFAIISLLKSRKKGNEEVSSAQAPGISKQILKGIIINGLNPSVFIFWLGIVSAAIVKYQPVKDYIGVFFVSIILTVLVTDNLKAYLADKLSKLITTRFLQGMNIVVGIAFLVFAFNLYLFAFDLKLEDKF